MKRSTRMFATCLLCCSLFFISCSDNAKKTAGATNDSTTTNGQTVKGSEKDQANLEVIATDICDCVSNYESELSDDAKEKIIHADRNTEVDTTWKLLSPKDQEVYQNEGKKSLNCISALFKKYPSLQKLNKNNSRELSDVLKEHCSEFASALVSPGN